VHPVLDAGGDGDPDPVPGVAEHEVHLADGLAVDAVGQHARGPIPRHDFQAVRPEIGYQDVAVGGEGQAVRQRAGKEPGRVVGGLREVARPFLGDELLRAAGIDSGYASAGIGGPQGAVRFGQYALGPRQIMANVTNSGLIYFEIEDRVARHAAPPVDLAPVKE